MKNVTLLAKVEIEKCKGCRICEKVCPVLAISLEDNKAKIQDDACRGCTNCESRCPFHAIKMIRREKPFKIGVKIKEDQREAILQICENAHMNPQQILCYCVGVRAAEVASAILDGAHTPEAISLLTGIRTGCTIECIQPLLRMLAGAGIELTPSKTGWQWYGLTTTAWNLPEEVKEKYNSRGFYFKEDKDLLDIVAKANLEGENAL